MTVLELCFNIFKTTLTRGIVLARKSVEELHAPFDIGLYCVYPGGLVAEDLWETRKRNWGMVLSANSYHESTADPVLSKPPSYSQDLTQVMLLVQQ